ncbi:MAG: homoserine kinase [Chloroflexi bacterium]|nr:homoserine kinase [Chloroflexota bacterium]
MTAITRVDAFAPATVANLGVGFDILGLALQAPGDIVRAEWGGDDPCAALVAIEGDNGLLPRDAKNTAIVSANHLLKTLKARRGVNLTIYKHLPLASGLGSSAASAVAAVVAVNALFGEPLTRADLLPSCLEGEAAVSGYHADNVAPALFGGITLVTGTSAHQILQLPVPADLHLALVTPDVAVPTALARAVLPKEVPLRTLVAQTAGVARVIDALYRGDIPSLAAAMESDSVIEPARAHLMPRLAEMRLIAKNAGAYGLVISGAGPTLCAVCASAAAAQRIAEAMKKHYDAAGIASAARHTLVATGGAVILETGSEK